MKTPSEIKFFLSQPRNIKTLLGTNLLFAMVLPLIEIFASAYIMRNTGTPSYVIVYQLCMYIGVVLSAVINGFLMRWFRSPSLYGFGILVSSVSLMVMMFITKVNIPMLCSTGFLLGLSTGFFWTNRYLLTLYSTNDENRNYFFGFESFFFSFWNIVIPLAVGAFLTKIDGCTAFGKVLDTNMGYRILTIFAFVISCLACFVLSKGNFKSPEAQNFFHLKFHKLWMKMLSLAGLKGMVQGFLVTAPSILIMKFIGEEGSIGLIQGIAGAVTAILVYVLGRIAKPKHRMPIFAFGIVVFFVGTLCSCFMFSATGVLAFIVCKVLFQPFHDLAYYPIQMRTIDTVSAIEHRDGYTYILSHEIGLFVGRAFGMILFIVLAAAFSEDIALRFALPIVAAIQLLSIPLAQNITKSNDKLQQK